jgi:hypothetical protein
MTWACSSHGRDEKYIQSFAGIPEGKRPLGQEDNIKIGHEELR